MTIPQIRARLLALAEERGIPELAVLAEQTRRRCNGRKARPKCAPMTEERAASIRAFADTHPLMSMLDIGIRFHVNQGRVSEALFGKREEDKVA